MASNFTLKSLRDWRSVVAGEMLELEVPRGGSRTVECEVLASSWVSAHVVLSGVSYLVAAGQGLMSLSFVVSEPGALVFEAADQDVVISLRTHALTQTIDASDEASFTSLEPRSHGPSDEFKRMMRVVQLNNARREAQLFAEIEALKARVPEAAEPVVEPVVTAKKAASKVAGAEVEASGDGAKDD